MLGPALLVTAVGQGETSVQVYLPKGLWYNYHSLAPVSRADPLTLETPLHVFPVLLRGGFIIPRRDRIRRSSTLALHDPYTLVIALDSAGEARGELYWDDGATFSYVSGEYGWAGFEFKNGVLKGYPKSYPEWGNGKLKGMVVERILVAGLPRLSSVSVQGRQAEFKAVGNGVWSVKKPEVLVGEEWVVEFK